MEAARRHQDPLDPQPIFEPEEELLDTRPFGGVELGCLCLALGPELGSARLLGDCHTPVGKEHEHDQRELAVDVRRQDLRPSRSAMRLTPSTRSSSPNA